MSCEVNWEVMGSPCLEREAIEYLKSCADGIVSCSVGDPVSGYNTLLACCSQKKFCVELSISKMSHLTHTYSCPHEVSLEQALEWFLSFATGDDLSSLYSKWPLTGTVEKSEYVPEADHDDVQPLRMALKLVWAVVLLVLLVVWLSVFLVRH